MPENEPIVSSDNESYLCGLAENVTSLLLQQQDFGKVESSPRAPRTNTCHLVVTGQDAETPKSVQGQRLAIQRLPDNFIRGELTLQQLPSIHIPPFSQGTTATSDNIKVYVVKHPPSPTQKLSRQDSVEVSMREEERTSSKGQKTDVGLQVQMTESSEKEIPIEKRIEFLRQKFRKESKLLKGFDGNQKLGELFRKVEVSGKLCQRYSRLSPTCNVSPNKGKNSHGTKSSVPSTVNSVQSLFSEAQRKSLMIKSDVEEDYKSDFEVESLVVDDSLGNSDRNDNKSLEAKKASDSGNRFKPYIRTSTPPSPLRDPNVSLRSPTRTKDMSERNSRMDSSSITDESIIEEQMKRLGLSPERMPSPKRVFSGRPRSAIRENLTRDPKKSSMQISSRKIRQESVERNVEGERPNLRTFYVKSDGKYIPVEPLQAPKVQIIVPEIVVKLPESINRPVACRSREVIEPPPHRTHSPVKQKQDQVIQTDEGCGTLTSGETNSVVEKLNKHFERTQLLLDRIGGRSSQMLDGTCTGQNSLLGLLHRRYVFCREPYSLEIEQQC